MAVYSRIVDFLPEKTQLMVYIKPSGNYDKNLEKFFKDDINNSKNINDDKTKKNVYIQLDINEPLKIEFSISEKGTIQKQCKDCKCITDVLDGEILESLNHAYKQISGKIEKDRRSEGGNIYHNIFFQEHNGTWERLEDKRNKLYKPYEEDFEKRKRIILEKKNYAKPLNKTNEEINNQPQILDEIIKILELQNEDLRIENIDLQQKIKQLNTLLEKSKLTSYKKKIKEFKQRLEQDYPEVIGKDSWQEWIYKNNWIFGIQYGTPIGHPRVGFRSILDYLFPTPDGFVDILEIKKPSHEVIEEDKSHAGAFKWSKEVNEAIGQVIKYLSEIELHQLIIAKELQRELSLDLSTIKPRAFILIGKSKDWSDKKKEAFRRLNHSLHGIEVLTYTDLLRRGENLIKVYGD